MRYDSSLGMLGGKPRPGGLRSTLCISSQVMFSRSYMVGCFLPLVFGACSNCVISLS